DLRRLDPPSPEPACEQVEEMHPVFNEDATALVTVPEPVLGRQALVAGVILEVGMEQLAQWFALQESLDRVEQRIVALHQVGRKQQAALSGDGEHLIRLCQVQGAGLLDQDVL